MMNWFYNWLDSKTLKIEGWVCKRVIQKDNIDLDLDRVKKNMVRGERMFKQPPSTGEYGPCVANLQGAVPIEHLFGPGKLEAFALLKHNRLGEEEFWWRHRDSGSTTDFRQPAFSSMEEFFTYVTGDGKDKYWDCVLRTKALEESDG